MATSVRMTTYHREWSCNISRKSVGNTIRRWWMGRRAVSEQNFLSYGVSTTPTLTLVDRRGIVRLYHPGGMTYQELRSAINGVLQAP
jgi:hypothetical protein